ncbi:MAG: putative Ig domain-containing protein, partial [Dolichospermum sp.]
DLGATPLSIANNNVDNARLISIGFNAALTQALTNLEPVLNVNLSLVDIFGLSAAVQANPASYNLTNITQPLITATNPVDPNQYAFWDDFHPTTKLHQLVTGTFENTLLNDGVIPDLIKYSATLADGSNLPDWLNFNSTTRTFTGTPKTANIGQLNVKVIATDKDGANVSDIFTLYVENVNNAPTNLTLSNSTVAENKIVGTVVGNLSTTDPDTGNTFTYSLVSGGGATDNSLFSISNNRLKTNSVFDYETKNSYGIRVKTTDQGGLSYEKELTINVNDLNEITGNALINNGRNPIVGTAGSDYITGGPGAKTITGGAGSDFFVFTNLRDVGQRITDFTVGEDKIVLTQLLSSINYNGADPIADQYMRFVAGTGSNANSIFLQIDRDGSLGSAIFKNFLQVDNITTTQLNNVNNFVF